MFVLVSMLHAARMTGSESMSDWVACGHQGRSDYSDLFIVKPSMMHGKFVLKRFQVAACAAPDDRMIGGEKSL